MDLHEALAGQSPARDDGEQMRAHWVGFWEPAVSRTHSGLAAMVPG